MAKDRNEPAAPERWRALIPSPFHHTPPSRRWRTVTGSNANQRFVMEREIRSDAGGLPKLLLVENWFEEVKERVRK